VHSRTRRLLTGATLTLLAVAAAAGLGASKAAAASQTVHKITACGYTAHAPGTYELTRSVTDSGSGPCILVNASNVTLYLDGHSITGSGTDVCLEVATGSNTIANDTVVAGTKAKPTKTATFTNCATGLLIDSTSGTTVSHLKIVAPTDTGVVAVYAGGLSLSNVSVPLQTKDVVGILLENGADNVVTKSTVNNNGGQPSFLSVGETGDSFTYDTANDPYSASGNTGKGFLDVSGSRNTFSHDTSKGQFDGFFFVESGSGPVTATHDNATGPSANANSHGFFVLGAFSVTNPASPFHTVISHNTATGFQYGYQDENGGTGTSEKWTNNTTHGYSLYGFYVDYATDYTMTGNVADANPSGKTYAGGTSYGFFINHISPVFAFRTFANNEAYDSQYGFVSTSGSVIGGKGNIAKRNQFNTYRVEIS
jgi:hypothetical protein